MALIQINSSPNKGFSVGRNNNISAVTVDSFLVSNIMHSHHKNVRAEDRLGFGMVLEQVWTVLCAAQLRSFCLAIGG